MSVLPLERGVRLNIRGMSNEGRGLLSEKEGKGEWEGDEFGWCMVYHRVGGY